MNFMDFERLLLYVVAVSSLIVGWFACKRSAKLFDQYQGLSSEAIRMSEELTELEVDLDLNLGDKNPCLKSDLENLSSQVLLDLAHDIRIYSELSLNNIVEILEQRKNNGNSKG